MSTDKTRKEFIADILWIVDPAGINEGLQTSEIRMAANKAVSHQIPDSDFLWAA